MPLLNEFHQPVGAPMPYWTRRATPSRVTLTGRLCEVMPLDAARHGPALFDAYQQAPDGRDWTYMMAGPFDTLESYQVYCERIASMDDPLQFAVIDLSTGKPVGTFALMRIDPANGVIEVGSVAFSPRMRRTALSTEAHYLLMCYVFEDLGYRRYEWKCDNFNAPSKNAAERLGFRFEGVFRQAVVYRNRTRDTAWFSMLDDEWPARRAAFQAWLTPDNFDTAGQQRRTLQAIRDIS